MTSSDKAIRKASSKRLLADFARAARYFANVKAYQQTREGALDYIATETSRTRYACLMTAFGK